jgi:GTP cyclohydrolase II
MYSAMQNCERAMFDLRRGVAVIICAEDGDRMILPVETSTTASRTNLERTAGASASLVLGRQRLTALGYRDAPAAGCLPAVEETLNPLAWGSPDGHDAVRMPLLEASHAERAAVGLLKRALLMPAVLSVPITQAVRARMVSGCQIIAVSATQVEAAALDSARRIQRVSEADIPLERAGDVRFILFREPDGMREHVAVRIGDPSAWPAAVPVRLHSACLTGDLFGSLRCDCGEQLRGGVERIAEAGGGVLLYLAQEGRGIGLANKLRAYALQDCGADTVEADARLGFSEDERRYDVAVQMLRDLGIATIRLLTNNPAKIAAMEAGGIEIADREELYGRLNEHNERYLRAKADRSGHLLGEWLETESTAD